MEKIWKDVIGFEGFYKINNFGDVKSLSRIVNNSYGTTRRIRERILATHKDKDGYLIVTFSINNKKTTHKVHRLVAEAFIPNPESKNTVNHIDGNKSNNIVTNLEWATDSEQIIHRITVLGQQCTPSEKCRESWKRKVCRSDGKIYNSIKEAGLDNNAFPSNITMCCQGKCRTIAGYSWKYVD